VKLSAPQGCRTLIVGFTVPQDDIEAICRVDRFMPMQTHKLAWSVVHGLEINGGKVDLVSSQPVGTYPANPNILFGFRTWRRGNGSWNVIIPFINLICLKHLTRFLACLSIVGWWVIRTRHEQNRFILLHGVHSPFMYAALVIRQLSRVKVVTIVGDPPGVVLSGEGYFIRLLRRIDAGIIKKALRLMDGLITLTKQLAAHYAPRVPSIVLEGILYAEDYTSSENCITDPSETENHQYFSILYAGGLQYEYGVDLLLKAFSLIDDLSFRLCILGKGNLADQIQTASRADDRIVFKGFCSPSEVKQLMKKATVLINPRPSNQTFTQFSFPSKTIEYMVSGRPVISTRLPGIPDEYSNYLYYLEDESPEGLAQMLKKVCSKPAKELEEYGARARDFIINNKNCKSQGKRILDFLNTL
jgi:glycosyltransferase involved in cell wall biosynthesis